ncbi:MAG: BCCT family transporter [Rhodospirillaceae bacterium]
MPQDGTASGLGRTRLSPPVFFPVVACTVAMLVLGTLWPDRAATLFADAQHWIVETFGWLYVVAVAVFLVFVVVIALGPAGRIRLGPDDAEPDYGTATWFAMLFSAGMGIGLMYFGVAEPMMHYISPPVGEGGTVEAARRALVITFFHWGLHAWAIYAVVGLALAYFAFRHRLPLAVRSALFPLFGRRIYGPIGHAADVFAVLGTMFGVATSLGLGVMQIGAGAHYLFGTPNTLAVQLVLIAGITLCATASAASGLDVGIRRLSELNLGLALLLVLFVFLTGPTLFLLKALVQNVGAYFSDIVEKTFTLYAYRPSGWIGGWTLFYWAWWIAWSPFVGMFIARVSRGRTVREFVLGVLAAPVGFTFIWMTVFGNAAISLDRTTAAGAIAAAVDENVSTALFHFLEFLPLSSLSAIVATVLVVTFFVTSADSAALVMDTIASGGADDGPIWQRILWALSAGAVAAVLLAAGGLKALQTASITAALPFTVVLLFVCYGLAKALQRDTAHAPVHGYPAAIPIRGADVPWQQRLRTLLSHPSRERAHAFLDDVAAPALNDVAAEIRSTGLEAEAQRRERGVELIVRHGEGPDFIYDVRLRRYAAPEFAVRERVRPGAEDRHRYYRAEPRLLDGEQDYDVMGYTREQLIGDVLSHYERHVALRQPAR